jgi:hypothetical protein
MREKAKIWRDFKGSTQTKLTNPKHEKFCPGSPKGAIENIMFFNILPPMGKTRNAVYKNL